jgi:hypothetical protein
MPIIETHHIYLVNQGLSCQEITKNIENCLRKNKVDSSKFRSNLINLKKHKENQLSVNGIIEIRESRKNNELSDLSKKAKFFSILSRPCIESGIIFSGNIKNAQLNIIPFKGSDLQLRKNSNLTQFKESFGGKSNNLKKYWNIPNNLINKSAHVKLNWSLVDKMDLSKISYIKFEKLIQILEKYALSLSTNTPLFLFVNEEIMIQYLKLIKNKKYTYHRNIVIENSSVIKLELKVEKISSNQIKTRYSSYQKIYPTKFNYEPLKIINNQFCYHYKNTDYCIMNNQILNYVSLIYPLRCPYEEHYKKLKDILNKKNNIITDVKKNKIENNKNENIKRKHINSFENVFTNLNIYKKN